MKAKLMPKKPDAVSEALPTTALDALPEIDFELPEIDIDLHDQSEAGAKMDAEFERLQALLPPSIKSPEPDAL